MSKVFRFPELERRRDNQRLLWAAPPNPGIRVHIGGYHDRRLDRDGGEAAIQLSKLLLRGDAAGLLFGLLRADGRIETGVSGTLYDSPLIAAGIGGQVQTMINDWFCDRSQYTFDTD